MGRAIAVNQDEDELARWSVYLEKHAPYVSRNAAMRGALLLALSILDEDPSMLFGFMRPETYARGIPKPRATK